MTRHLLAAAALVGVTALSSGTEQPTTSHRPAPAARPSQLSDRDLLRLYAAAGKTAPKRLRRHAPRRRPGDPTAAQLRRVAWCESGRDGSAAVNSTSRARGVYQFLISTWASVGGHGDPAAASYAEQTHRAVLLYRREGWTPWLASTACTGLR